MKSDQNMQNAHRLKQPSSPMKYSLALLTVLAASLPVSLNAADRYWPEASTSGIWTTTSNAWSSTPTGSGSLPWTQGDNATIQGSNPQITLGNTGALSVDVTNLTIQNNLTLVGADQNRVLNINGSGQGNLSVNGSGTGYLRVYLNGSTAYLGTVSANEQASNTIVITGTGTSVGTSTKVNLTGGTLALDSTLAGKTATIGELSGTSGKVTAGFNTASGTRTLKIDQATNTTFAGSLEESGSNRLAIIKSGSGTLSLTGNAAYFGGTTVEQGSLYWNGTSSGLNNFTVKSEATLGGNGQIVFNTANTRAVYVESGGRLAPGSASTAGTLIIGGGKAQAFQALQFAGAAEIQMRLGTTQDKIVLDNPLFSGFAGGGTGSITFKFINNGGVAQNTVYDLISFGTDVSPGIALSKYALSADSITDGWQGSFSYSGNVLQFTVTNYPVPEPSTLAAVLLGVGVIWASRGMKREARRETPKE